MSTANNHLLAVLASPHPPTFYERGYVAKRLEAQTARGIDDRPGATARKFDVRAARICCNAL